MGRFIPIPTKVRGKMRQLRYTDVITRSEPNALSKAYEDPASWGDLETVRLTGYYPR